MKKWKITIRAENETKAIEFLEMLKSGFETANKIQQPMEYMFLEQSNKRESLTCILIKKINNLLKNKV